MTAVRPTKARAAEGQIPQPIPPIVELTRDPKLFGPRFGSPSWDPSRAFHAACFGQRMDQSQLDIYRSCTGRQDPPSGPFREVWRIGGRRSGKSSDAALAAVVVSCFRDYSAALSPGERGFVTVIATDRRQAQVVLGYIRAHFREIPMLRTLVERETHESIVLVNGISIEVHTASFRSVRGYTIVAAILDEVGFWRVEGSADPDGEIVAALRPALATVPGSLLLGISSPHARRGILWEMFRDFYGTDDPRVLVWKSATRTMNHTVPQHVIDDAYTRDPASAAAEWGGEFRSDIETFVSHEVIDACTIEGRHELPPCEAFAGTYQGFCDPSGGSADSMTLAIAHREEDRVVIDLVREAKPPFSPSDVVAEFADTLKAYGLGAVCGDRYGAGWVSEAFRKQGITYTPAEKPKSALYVEFLPALNSGQVELLDHRKLAAQLTSLERRTARGGRDSIDHPPSGHDDIANCVAGVCHRLAQRRKQPVTGISLGGLDDQVSPWGLDSAYMGPWRRETHQP